jgi:hypothetical protein
MAALQESLAQALADDPQLREQVNEKTISRVNAAAFREQGNSAFMAKDFAAAERIYGLAIAIDSTDAALFSNRCAPLIIVHWTTECRRCCRF